MQTGRRVRKQPQTVSTVSYTHLALSDGPRFDRIDEDVDVQRIRREIHGVDLSGCDEITARNEDRQKEHALEEVVSRMEDSLSLIHISMPRGGYGAS